MTSTCDLRDSACAAHAARRMNPPHNRRRSRARVCSHSPSRSRPWSRWYLPAFTSHASPGLTHHAPRRSPRPPRQRVSRSSLVPSLRPPVLSPQPPGSGSTSTTSTSASPTASRSTSAHCTVRSFARRLTNPRRWMTRCRSKIRVTSATVGLDRLRPGRSPQHRGLRVPQCSAARFASSYRRRPDHPDWSLIHKGVDFRFRLHGTLTLMSPTAASASIPRR